MARVTNVGTDSHIALHLLAAGNKCPGSAQLVDDSARGVIDSYTFKGASALSGENLSPANYLRQKSASRRDVPTAIKQSSSGVWKLFTCVCPMDKLVKPSGVKCKQPDAA